MQLAKFRSANGTASIGIVEGDSLLPLKTSTGDDAPLSKILEADDPVAFGMARRDTSAKPIPIASVALLAPLDRQEVWAAGVTYKRSKTARMEESESAATLYDKVYASERPELFFKATPHRVAGPGEPLRIRKDSKWNVPEPELALVLSSRLKLVGLTIGKIFIRAAATLKEKIHSICRKRSCTDACCGLGPSITLGEPAQPLELGIQLAVRRAGQVVFEGSTNTRQMARSLADLIGWLGRDNSFPNGAFLLTGTGIIPDSDFTLRAADVVEITIDGLGTLSNPIVQASSPA